MTRIMTKKEIKRWKTFTQKAQDNWILVQETYTQELRINLIDVKAMYKTFLGLPFGLSKTGLALKYAIKNYIEKLKTEIGKHETVIEELKSNR